MRKLVVLGLGLAFGGAATSTCSALPSSVHPGGAPKMACARAYTPAKGGATRKQIADALRRSVGESEGMYAVFNFDWIKASGNWAYAETRPESPDGEEHYAPVSALLRRSGSQWRVVARLDSREETPARAMRRVRNKFPSAPRDIFP